MLVAVVSRSRSKSKVLDCARDMQIEIRQATTDESETLTALAHVAKRHWGYPEEWIEHWKSDLAITSEFIADHAVFVAIIEGKIAGCCALVVTGSLAELEHMWIDPEYMGNGIGRALFEATARRAEQLGLQRLELSADPNAEGFYQRMGARRIGEVRADVAGTFRVLPRMRIEFGVRPSRGSANPLA